MSFSTLDSRAREILARVYHLGKTAGAMRLAPLLFNEKLSIRIKCYDAMVFAIFLGLVDDQRSC